MDADLAQIELAATSGADRIELYTEDYAAAHASGDYQRAFDQYAEAAAGAQDLGLGVNAGHDLNLDNLAHFLTIPDVLEVSIGHALIADALKMGLSAAVAAYLDCLS